MDRPMSKKYIKQVITTNPILIYLDQKKKILLFLQTIANNLGVEFEYSIQNRQKVIKPN